MVHIHITAKPSTRYPGKNNLLWPYTRVWLENELQELNDAARVIVTIRDNGLNGLAVPREWEVYSVSSAHYTHESDLRTACNLAGHGGYNVLLQLTQPLRRQGLLHDAVKALSTHPAATVMSESGGVMDGALYAWHGDPACVFKRRNPYYVHNIDRKLDIDTAEDVPDNLDYLWSKLMLEKD